MDCSLVHTEHWGSDLTKEELLGTGRSYNDQAEFAHALNNRVNQMDCSMVHAENRGSYLTEEEFLGTGQSCNHQAELAHLLSILSNQMDGSMVHTEHWSYLTVEELLGTGKSCNNQAELAHPLNILSNHMDGSMVHTEHWSYLTVEELLGTGKSCNNQAELAHLVNNPQPDVEAGESAAAYTGRKRGGRKPTLTPDERRKRKNASDKNYRKDHKDKYDRLMKIASECGGIDKMESDFQRLKQLKSKYGGFEEIDSKLNKLEQMEAKSEIFEKEKNMFGGIDNIVARLDRLRETEIEHWDFKNNQTEILPLIDCLRSPAGDSDMVREYVICDVFLTVGTLYSDVLVTDFIAKLETNTRSNVNFSSFKDLDGERQRVGNYSFPISLVSTVNAIMEAHGDVTRNCLLGPSAAENTYVLLCAAIKEMGDLSLKEVGQEIMLKWRDAIMDARRIGFDVEFAWEHLKTIAYGYFGLKARNYRTSLKKSMTNLMDDQNSLKQKLEKNVEEVKAVKAKIAELTSSPCIMCLDCADRFQDKNVGLFG